MARLIELQRIPTSGARAVEPFVRDGVGWLAIPQMAADQPGTPDGINGGTSDTRVLLLRDCPDGFVEAESLAIGGGEDVESFELDAVRMLAVASIRTGSGPYDFAATSPIFAATSGGYDLVQQVPSIAAKQWRFLRAGGEAFLALAQGHPSAGGQSLVFRWDGRRFEPLQSIESVAGYNFRAFDLDGVTYLAHADHAVPSRLYRYDGARFQRVQDLVAAGGRAFELIRQGGEVYLAVARINGDSVLLRWEGDRFSPHGVLPGGPGGREFATVQTDAATYLLRVDFIHGTPAEPNPDLQSQIYRVDDGGTLTPAGHFPTTGGTDVTLLTGSGLRVAVSNGLAAHPRPGATFAADTVVYRFDEDQ